MMEHYLNGDGSPKRLPARWVRDYAGTMIGEMKSMRHYEEWLTGARDKNLGTLSNVINAHQGEESWTIQAMAWDGGGADDSDALLLEKIRRKTMEIEGPPAQYPGASSDQYFTLGDMTVKGNGPLQFRRQGNKIIVEGNIQFYVFDVYDFSKKGWLTGYQPMAPDFDKIPPWIDRNDITHLEKQGGAARFNIESDRWGRKFTATLLLDENGNATLETMNWGQAYITETTE